MATKTATGAQSAQVVKNAAETAASQQPASRRPRVIVAAVPKPTGNEAKAECEQARPLPVGEGHATPAPGAKPQAGEEQKREAAGLSPKEPTAEEKAAQLEREIQQRAKQLQAALSELTRKKELNEHRTQFLETLEKLDGVEEALEREDGFTATCCKLTFRSVTDSYGRGDDLFSIGQSCLMKEFITFIRAKIRVKVDDIEAELIK